MQNSSIVSKRNLNCYIYSLICENSSIKTHEKSLKYLKKIGFNVPDTYKKCVSINDVKKYIHSWKNKSFGRLNAWKWSEDIMAYDDKKSDLILMFGSHKKWVSNE